MLPRAAAAGNLPSYGTGTVAFETDQRSAEKHCSSTAVAQSRSIIASASGTRTASWYGRLAVIASKMSATVMMRTSKGDRVAGEATRIALAVQPLVVRAGGRGKLAGYAEAGENVLRKRGMVTDGRPFCLIETPGFVENRVAHAEFSEIVQQRGAMQAAAALFGEAEASRDCRGDGRDTTAVGRRETALGINDIGEGAGDLIEPRLVE